jgi:hypothetical protein
VSRGAMNGTGASVERCDEHHCCIRAHDITASARFPHLAGEWHLEWMPDDRAWFLVPPHGNVFEIRVLDGADPVGEIAVDGVLFDGIREEIARNGLFPPC